MSENDKMKWKGKLALLTVVALGLGVFIGVTVEGRAGDNSTPAKKAEAATSTTASDANAKSNDGSGAQSQTMDEWDPFQEMRDMQAEMDRMFQNSIQRFQMNPQMNLLNNSTGYSSSLDVRDLKDHYEVRAYLPDAKTSDTKVNLDGNQLTVEVTNQQSQKQVGKSGTMSTQSWGHYQQMVELDGKLKADKMKIEKKDHELLITIPKAMG